MITNKTKQTIITKDYKIAKTTKDRMLGLLIKSNPRCMVFKTRFGIHTFFMKEPIDVLVLDKQNKVGVIKNNLKPWRIFFWNPSFEAVVELPADIIDKTKTKLGDEIVFN